jgi:prolyl-tRNA synthetase
MRYSKAFIPTSKEAPSDAVLSSHIFLARAGFVTQVASGLYNYLPLAKKVLRKIETIVHEEMASIDAQEVELSFVTPANLWEESGRIEKFGKELLRFKDRKDNDFVLGPTHEEMMVNIVRNRITSYKQLPMNLYQVKTKFRDEARPRFGLMRGREFIMKDGYSFHASTEDLDREFDVVESAYKRILNRLGLEYRVVEADSGSIGGSGSKELMVIADSGEDTIAVCSSCEYGANIEAAKRAVRTVTTDAPTMDFNRFKTPNITSIDTLSDFFKIDSYYTLKTVAKRAIFENETKIVLFFMRGCDELQEVKATSALKAIDLEDVNEDDLKALGLVPGFMGPLDIETISPKIDVYFDEDIKDAKNIICGANELDFHFIGVDLSVLKLEEGINCSDIVEVKEGDGCPICNKKEATLSFTKGIEVGHIFKLGDTYSKALKADYLNDKGQATPFTMGTYGLGISRLMASVIEQHHDEKGCIWTESTAPYLVNVMISNIKDENAVAFAENLYQELQKTGIDVMLDDRKERFGFKMKDAELIGYPYTVIIGKSLAEGTVEVMSRKTLEKEAFTPENVFDGLLKLLNKEK